VLLLLMLLVCPCCCLPSLQESFSTTVLVFIMFQLPVVLWLTRQRQLRV
jgi:hypothetical protein